MLRIERVRPLEFAESASRILTEAWPPTALHYTPQYLRWQFNFPGATALPAVAALDGDEPIGFIGVTKRRAYFANAPTDILIVSFVAVRPNWRGKGIASRLYAALLEELRSAPAPPRLLTFAIEDSTGERTALRAYNTAGLQTRMLEACQAYGCVSRARPVTDDWQADVFEGPEMPATVLKRCLDQTTIWAGGGAAQIAHYRQDPSPRRLLLLRRRDEPAGGAAWVKQSEFVTAQGLDKVTTVDSVYLRDPDDAALAALFSAAARCWQNQGAHLNSPVTVLASNLWGVERSALARIGVRAGHTRFRAYFSAFSADEPLLKAQGTNIEVV